MIILYVSLSVSRMCRLWPQRRKMKCCVAGRGWGIILVRVIYIVQPDRSLRPADSRWIMKEYVI